MIDHMCYQARMARVVIIFHNQGCSTFSTLRAISYFFDNSKIDCIHVAIIHLNALLSLLVRAISNTLEHLYVNYCIKPIKTEAYFRVNKRSLKNHQIF